MRTCDLPFEVTDEDRMVAASVWCAMAIHVTELRDKDIPLSALPFRNTIAREAGAQRIAAIRNGFDVDKLKEGP